MTKPNSIPRKLLDSMFLEWDNQHVGYAQLYHIIVPDLAITMKNLENGKLSVWITYFERLSKPDLYKELAQVIVTSKMVESDTGLKIVTVEKSVDNNMPPIPERDRQLADLLALRVFDTDRSSLTRSEQLKPHELDLVKADRERRKLFFASLFKGLRMYWSRCRLSPENIFPLTKTENLVHEQLLFSPHLWTFMAYTADHIEKNDDCGEQMLKVLMEKLNEEEIARLPAVMTDEDDGIFFPLSTGLSRHWNSNDESLNSLTKTLGLEEDPLSSPKIVPMFFYYRHFSKPQIRNVLLLREFLATKYPKQDFEEVMIDRLISARHLHRKAISEILFSKWINKGYSVRDIKRLESENRVFLRAKYENFERIAKRMKEFGLQLKFDKDKVQQAFNVKPSIAALANNQEEVKYPIL